MPLVEDASPETERSRVTDVLVGLLYAAVVGANLYLVYDWWRETPGGTAAIERWQSKAEALKVKAQECEGCAKRKAFLRAQVNRMHWDAEQIVDGADVPTVPEV